QGAARGVAARAAGRAAAGIARDAASTDLPGRAGRRTRRPPHDPGRPGGAGALGETVAGPAGTGRRRECRGLVRARRPPEERKGSRRKSRPPARAAAFSSGSPARSRWTVRAEAPLRCPGGSAIPGLRVPDAGAACDSLVLERLSDTCAVAFAVFPW